jgi:hypothetical protein
MSHGISADDADEEEEEEEDADDFLPGSSSVASSFVSSVDAISSDGVAALALSHNVVPGEKGGDVGDPGWGSMTTSCSSHGTYVSDNQPY